MHRNVHKVEEWTHRTNIHFEFEWNATTAHSTNTHTPHARMTNLCHIYNNFEYFSLFSLLQLSDDLGYVVYSALGSFYIPSCIMVFVYIRIYFAAKARARRGIKKKPIKSKEQVIQKTKCTDKINLELFTNRLFTYDWIERLHGRRMLIEKEPLNIKHISSAQWLISILKKIYVKVGKVRKSECALRKHLCEPIQLNGWN